MTMFDLIALVVLAVSALVGLIRGFVREVVTVVAFVVAAAAAIFGLRFTGPLARDAIDPDWAGSILAVLVVFAAVYLLVRVAAGAATRGVHRSSLGSIDRAAGFGIGLLRGLVVLGVFHLLFNLVTPADRVPAWVQDSWMYPVAGQSGRVLARLAPGGAAQAGRFGPSIERAVREGVSAPPTADETPQTDYESERSTPSARP